MLNKTTELVYYILFFNYTDGLALNKILKKKDIPSRVCPVPRDISSSCGMAVAVSPDNLDKAKEAITESGIEIEKILPLEHISFKQSHFKRQA